MKFAITAVVTKFMQLDNNVAFFAREEGVFTKEEIKRNRHGLGFPGLKYVDFQYRKIPLYGSYIFQEVLSEEKTRKLLASKEAVFLLFKRNRSKNRKNSQDKKHTVVFMSFDKDGPSGTSFHVTAQLTARERKTMTGKDIRTKLKNLVEAK